MDTLRPMTSFSTHHFGDLSLSDDAFSIRILEVLVLKLFPNSPIRIHKSRFLNSFAPFQECQQKIEEEYGMFVWPCSVVLAEYVWQQRSRFAGASVVELGAGTSLPGLVAAKMGSDVTLTDNSDRAEVLTNMRRVCSVNNLNCKILGLTWGEWDEPLFGLEPNIVLGADVLYDTKDFDNLFATVTFLLQRTPGSVFITTYHNRSGHHLVDYLMVKWGLKCSKLLDAFSFMPPQKTPGLRGNIQLVEIMLEQQPKSIPSVS